MVTFPRLIALALFALPSFAVADNYAPPCDVGDTLQTLAVGQRICWGDDSLDLVPAMPAVRAVTANTANLCEETLYPLLIPAFAAKWGPYSCSGGTCQRLNHRWVGPTNLFAMDYTNSSGVIQGAINRTVSTGSSSVVGTEYCEAAPPPPPGCDEAYVNTKIASFYPVGQNPPPQVCDTNSGCVAELQQRSGHCGPGECGFYYKIYGDFDCVPGDPDLEPGSIAPAPQETCQTIGNAEYCIGSAPDANNANCGYLNDQWVCVNNTPKGGCQDGAGGVLCDAAAGTPPGPDSGTAGTPATPDGQVKAETGPDGTVNTYNFFDSTTVSGSSRAPATGSPTGGGSGDSNGSGFTGDGDSEGEEGGTGSASGGESCASMPVCEGDPIQCAILAQQWRARCVEAPIASEVQAAAGLTAGEVDGSALIATGDAIGFSAITETGPLGAASCPAALSVTVMGQALEFDIWAGACDMALLFAPLVMFFSYFAAALLVYRGVLT